MRACALRGKRALGAVLKLDSSNFGECETGWLARFERERAATCSRFVLSASQPVVHSVRHSRSASQPKRVVRQTRSRALRCAARLVPLPQRRLRSSNTNDIVLSTPLTFSSPHYDPRLSSLPLQHTHFTPQGRRLRCQTTPTVPSRLRPARIHQSLGHQNERR